MRRSKVVNSVGHGTPRLPLSLAHYRLLAEHVSDVVLLVAPDDGYMWVSPSVLPALGWRPHEMVGKTLSDFAHPDDLDGILEKRRLAGLRPFAVPEMRFRRADGDYAWMSARSSPVTDEAGRLVTRVVVLRDISSEMASREGLINSEARFRLLAENASDIVFESGLDGVVRWVSPSTERILGWTPGQLVGSQAEHLVCAGSMQRFLELRAAVHRGEYVKDEPLQLHAADGSARWMSADAHPLLDESGQVHAVVGCLRDTHAEQAARRALAVLAAGNSILVRAEDERTLLHEMCQAAVDHGGYSFAWYGRGSDDADRSVVATATSREHAEYVDEIRVSWGDGPLSLGPTGTAIRTNQTVIADNFGSAERYRPWHDAAMRHGFASSICIPVRTAGILDGAFTVYASEPGAFGESNRDVLEELGSQLGIGLARLRANEHLRESQSTLLGIVDSTDDMIFAVDVTSFGLLWWNRSFERYFIERRRRRIAVGDRPEDLFDDRAYVDQWNLFFAETMNNGRLTADYAASTGSTMLHLTMNLLQVDGGAFAIAVFGKDVTEQHRADQRIAQYVHELEDALEVTLSVVAKAVEVRDPYTAGHQRRVGRIAALIARRMGWTEAHCHELELAGSVHDIGKIAVPAELLSKPATLNEAEYRLVQTHVDAGYEILRQINFPFPLAEIIRQHHERLDGSGYPRGLSGDDVLLEARILAVADVVEAMSSHRPYRAALGLDATVSQLCERRGTWYDPEVVDTVLALMQEDPALLTDGD